VIVIYYVEDAAREEMVKNHTDNEWSKKKELHATYKNNWCCFADAA
jgi:hypothetical protein